MFLTLVISGKNAPYIDGQWLECPLHWWSVRRMSYTLVTSGSKNVPYIGSQCEKKCPLHRWSLGGRISPTLGVSDKNNALYIV
ncbi:unnamed protein product, partial [Staurois parvus]